MKKPPHVAPSSVKESLFRTHHTFEDFFNKINTAVSIFEMRDNGVPGRYLEVNNMLCQWLGYTRKELLALSPLDISEKVDDGVYGDVANTSAQDGYRLMERTLLAKDGRRIPVETTLHYITYAWKKAVFSISRDISEMKTAETALHESEELFSKAFRASPIPMIITDLTDGKIMDFNDEFERFSGWNRTEALGRSTLELGLFVHPEDREVALNILQKEDHLRNFELALRTKSGEPLTFLWSTERINLGGEPRLLSTLHNITEQKEAEDALRASEERYRLLHEYAPIGILLVNRSGQILQVNSAVVQILGSPSAEATTAINFLTFPLLIEAGISAAFQRCVETGQVVSGEYPYTTKWRKSVHMLLRFVPIFDDHHKVNLVHVIAEDITERKQAEETLSSSQNMLLTVLDTIPSAVFWKDRNSNYLGGNRTWLDAIGVKSPEAVIGKTDYDLPWEQPQADSFREDDKRVMESGIAEYNIIEPFLRADGTHAWARTNKVPLRDRDGKVIGVLGTYEDITERKRMEEELHKAQKLESLGLLAGGIAHDFNNLMGGIFGNIDLALASSKDSIVSNYLSTAIGAIDRARNLTGQLLTFAKGGAPIREIGDLSPVIRNSSNLALSGSNVSCVFTMADDLWLCNFDKNQISQVIDNIVINAQQAMPMGSTVLISAINNILKTNEKGTLKAGNYVKISIKDSGVGIPESILPRIFDPFFTTKHKGSGLGLSICHSIVKKHDGWIDVESAPGKGATFHIYLPASLETSAQLSPQKPVSIHKGSGRILILDDEEIIRQSVGKMLNILGYSVECKRDGKETLAFLTEEIRAGRSFAAILLDLTIPGGMGGRAVALEIQKLNIKIPLFVTSGYSNDPVMSSPNNYGFTDSICKPFTIDEFAAMLNRHLQKR